jgi:hypothetical protein
LQAAMGWTYSHLHRFEIVGSLCFRAPELDVKVMPNGPLLW